MELLTRSRITEKQLLKRKRLGLIKYIFNTDNSVDWEKTIKWMEDNVKEYTQSKVQDVHNLERYIQYSDDELCLNNNKLL